MIHMSMHQFHRSYLLGTPKLDSESSSQIPDNIPLLYTTYRLRYDAIARQQQMRLFGRLNRAQAELLQSGHWSLINPLNSWRRDTTYTVQITTLSADNDTTEQQRSHQFSHQFSQHLTQQWQEYFTADLQTVIAHHEDHELELLLLRRFTGHWNIPQKSQWKQQPLAKFLFGAVGLNDISDAIPAEDSTQILRQVYDQQPPAPLILPPVPAEPVPGFTQSPLAKYVPRSCAYIEWPNWQQFQQSCRVLATQVQDWTPGTWPMQPTALLTHHLERCGLTTADLTQIADTPLTGVGVASWDFYLQSGTHLLLLIRTAEANALDLESSQATQIDAHTWICDTGSARLKRMAVSAFEQEKSLWQDPHFQQARQRFMPLADETEHAFLFLSDYWLTNFLSPRWMILSQRRRSVDARIRLTKLLGLIIQTEHGLDTAPDLATINTLSPLSDQDNVWMFDQLSEQEGQLRDLTHGGLFDHTPIDDLSFDRVSKAEVNYYNNFINVYERRWQQADPIALLVVSAPQQSSQGSAQARNKARNKTRTSNQDLARDMN